MPKKVLMIEDDASIASALSIRLTAQGYQALSAPDGRSGLAVASERMPDVILMDIRLPDIDGIEVCHRLNDDPTLAHIPVIFLSANINDVARNEAAGVGAVACIAKPYEIRDVVAAIEAATDSTACEA